MDKSLSKLRDAMAAAAAEQQQFYLLLGNLLSPDNVVRKQAEMRFETCQGKGRNFPVSMKCVIRSYPQT
ncbi:hypothetical protein FD755_015415 [Muntiacus reevesi]|uniref:Importin N-terminal domain-containing protein n=1 Tax=Muntiacus reevesi TaxID=9886 RepID=A0A5N3XG87_MUNRE|nr:hypothetical protein FD755_015415 [Muntiacus reevesi]